MRLSPLITALGFAFAAAACSTATRSERPAVMATTKLQMPPEQVRLRTIEQAADVARLVEVAADDILARTSDVTIRRNALLWKANMITAIETSIVQFDPLISFTDLYALCLQTDAFFRTGAGKDAFGPHQERALEATAQAIANIRVVSLETRRDSVGSNPSERAAQNWAEAHPIETLAFARQTMTTEAAKLITGDDVSAFAAVGRLDDNVTNLNTRVGLLLTYLPKQTRWEAQMLTEQLAGGPLADSALANMRVLTQSFERVTAVVESLPGLADWQRREVLAGITDQREALLHAVTMERKASFEAVAEQVTRLLNAITTERTATMLDAEGMLIRTVQQSQASVNAAIDHLVWRLAQLIAATLLLIGLGLGVLLYVLRGKTLRGTAA